MSDRNQYFADVGAVFTKPGYSREAEISDELEVVVRIFAYDVLCII